MASQEPPSAASSSGNPLTAPWPGPYGGVPPWDEIRTDDFPEAFEISLACERAEIEKIVASPAQPDFENTIAALQRSGHMKDRVLRLFDVMCLNLSTSQYQALDQE